VHNDYGRGFYCTQNIELAKEWACASSTGGFANEYSFDFEGLNVLNLSEPQYGILNWLAVLVDNRVFSITSPVAADAKEYLTEFFLSDINAFDVITGYRADDSYFTYAMDFLSNAISLRQLDRAMALGSLGEQVVMKSRKAFETIVYVRHEAVNGEEYYAKRMLRDREARETYLKRERRTAHYGNDIFMVDILREGMKQDDARLQRNLSE
jgi:hypothetical protein